MMMMMNSRVGVGRWLLRRFSVPRRTSSLRYLSNDTDTKDPEWNETYREQMMELQKEREELFEFTKEEKSAWQNRHEESTTASLQQVIAQHQQQQQPQQNNPSSLHENYHEQMMELQKEREELLDQASSQPLTHLSEDGTQVSMVDVGQKESTQRIAKAQTKVWFPPEVVSAFSKGSSSSWVGPKGPIFDTAKIAGIMAAKRTSELIPLCHPLPLDRVNIDIVFDDEQSLAVIECECRVTHKTGVEMEALTGATVAALTIYDMVKAVSHRVRIQDTVLISKSGGRRAIEPHAS